MSEPTVVDGMAEPTPEELRRAVSDSFAAWAALAERAGDRVNEPGAAGEWTLRDATAHLCAYDRFLVINFGGSARELGDMPEDIGWDFQKRNEWMHEQNRSMPWPEVIAEWRDVTAAMESILAGWDESELRKPMVDWQPWPRWRWAMDTVTSHYADHQAQAEAWLAASQ